MDFIWMVYIELMDREEKNHIEGDGRDWEEGGGKEYWRGRDWEAMGSEIEAERVEEGGRGRERQREVQMKGQLARQGE